MPLAFDDRPGSGLHVHQSADELFAGSGLSEIGRQFVAGQLHHARALSALTSPTTNSYRRLQTGPEAPSAAIWGHLSRAALIRVSPPGGLERSIEFRGSDPSANPYLVAAGLLVAGVFGIDDELELAPPSDEAAGAFDPADSQRFQPLPRNLDEALDALAADDRFVDALDPLLLDRLIDGRRAEAEYFRGHVTEQERSLYGEQG
jgi:glutamine synthetase